MDRILLLQSIPGFGSVKIRRFLRENRASLDDDDYINHRIYLETGQYAAKFLDNVKRVKESCYRLGVSIISGDIVNCIDNPLLLYIKGDRNLLSIQKKLAVVGTRRPSITGKRVGEELVKQAVVQRWVTVSGMAKGCDMSAHRVTINNRGRTIAVIPMGHRAGFGSWIYEHGLVVSEYPPNTNIEKFRCINRNRIIVGLSRGLYVIESMKGSGSEHSMKYAKSSNIPIAYSIGYPGIDKYTQQQITTSWEFDLFLEKCIL